MRRLFILFLCLATAAPALAAPADDARFRAISAREYDWARADGSGGEEDERIAPHLQDVRPAAQLKDASLVVRDDFHCASIRDIIKFAGHQPLADLRILEGEAAAKPAAET